MNKFCDEKNIEMKNNLDMKKKNQIVTKLKKSNCDNSKHQL